MKLTKNHFTKVMYVDECLNVKDNSLSHEALDFPEEQFRGYVKCLMDMGYKRTRVESATILTLVTDTFCDECIFTA